MSVDLSVDRWVRTLCMHARGVVGSGCPPGVPRRMRCASDDWESPGGSQVLQVFTQPLATGPTRGLDAYLIVRGTIDRWWTETQ